MKQQLANRIPRRPLCGHLSYLASVCRTVQLHPQDCRSRMIIPCCDVTSKRCTSHRLASPGGKHKTEINKPNAWYAAIASATASAHMLLSTVILVIWRYVSVFPVSLLTWCHSFLGFPSIHSNLLQPYCFLTFYHLMSPHFGIFYIL